MAGFLVTADVGAYETAATYLRKMRPIYEAIDKEAEWTAFVADIRQKHRNRPRLVEILDRLSGVPIVHAARRKK